MVPSRRSWAIRTMITSLTCSVRVVMDASVRGRVHEIGSDGYRGVSWPLDTAGSVGT